jgi:AcrR family transcriptional regulator
VFAERGFHSATTQDIADVLGIRQASLYIFPSKRRAELVCLQVSPAFPRWRRRSRQAPAAPPTSWHAWSRRTDPLTDRSDSCACS